MGFIATFVYLRGNVRVRLATQRISQVSTQVRLVAIRDFLPVCLTRALIDVF